MQKNYKRYWQILKTNGELTLSFQKENYKSLEKEIALWKAGLSRYKYLDYIYASKNPSTEIVYSTEEDLEHNSINLLAELRNKSYINPNNPKILFHKKEEENE